jgi:hypothetical protein
VKLVSEKNIPAHHKFNMHESEMSSVSNIIRKVTSLKGKRLVSYVVSTERGQTITVVCCMNPVGLL